MILTKDYPFLMNTSAFHHRMADFFVGVDGFEPPTLCL